MVLFYRNEQKRANLETRGFLVSAVRSLEAVKGDPSILLTSSLDAFGKPLEKDSILSSLRKARFNHFNAVAESISEAALTTLNRQLHRYLEGDLAFPPPEMLDICSSAPINNFHAERVLGRFCAQCTRAPNATTGFLEAKTKSGANKTLEWLTDLSTEAQTKVINFARTEGAKARKVLKEREEKLLKERLKRQFEVARKKDRSDRNKVEKKVKGFVETGSFDCLVGEVKEDMKEVARKILDRSEDVIGMRFRHMWEVDDEDVEFLGVLIEFKVVRTKEKIVIKYLQEGQEPVFSEMHVHEILADIIIGDFSVD